MGERAVSEKIEAWVYNNEKKDFERSHLVQSLTFVEYQLFNIYQMQLKLQKQLDKLKETQDPKGQEEKEKGL